ncbi:MAG: hypothetical protein AAF479_05940 [Pseudomonadota bacterium]
MAGVDEWNEADVIIQARNKVARGMNRAVQFAVGVAKVKVNRGNARGNNPSRPGEPPKKVSALLFSSIVGEVEVFGDTVTGRYGTNVVYGRRLELGYFGADSAGRVFNQAPRPFLRPILREKARTLFKLIAGSP